MFGCKNDDRKFLRKTNERRLLMVVKFKKAKVKETNKAKHYNRKVYKCKVFKLLTKEADNQIVRFFRAA